MRRNIPFFCLAFVLVGIVNPSGLFAQPSYSDAQIAEMIQGYKKDVRGPYKNIRWFCEDGTTRMPQDPCPDDVGGIQHATYKDDVLDLAEKNRIYLGQILAATDKAAFWDASSANSRLKQYLIGKYLFRVDDGWINRKGQFYRGAVQVEDEEQWGVDFYRWLLSDETVIEEHYYLVLQSLKDVPHQGDSDLSQQMRSLSKVISDEYAPFMDLRIKIHSNPSRSDIEQTVQFKKDHAAKLSTQLNTKFNALISVLQEFHKPVEVTYLTERLKLLDPESQLTHFIGRYIEDHAGNPDPDRLAMATAEVLLAIRQQVTLEKDAFKRLQLLDIANQLDAIAFKTAALWKAETVGATIDKICALSMASTGTGGLELWEWRQVKPYLDPVETERITTGKLITIMEKGRSVVEWSAAMVKAVFQKEVNSYTGFEPLTYGFIDDRVRSSVALPLGQTVGDLGAFIAEETAMINRVLDLRNQSSIRGLNPGYAFGELVVISGSPEDISVSGDKIYVFERAPSDLKPVAGIATVAEGNLVSHVQLLARNLGIPNAALSDENLDALKAYEGRKIFYAVSNQGNVIMKVEADMSPEEKALVTARKRSESKIEAPADGIRLDQKRILDLREVNAKDSGKSCGPKAANLGQLKAFFPENVVEGFVIPFGIFRDHMDQPMPGQAGSYWEFLGEMFEAADRKRKLGEPESAVEAFQLEQLETLRSAIKSMDLKPGFLNDLENSFLKYFGSDLGSVPVFLRSDTNMEDLKDFTGAGLNLTIFNAVDREKILQGIKDVWASPYTERSFKWRQRYLLNPENVFPSILVIPSVDVDYSGVVITKGITSGKDKDLTIAFSRGAGGAVDGQAAESFLVLRDGGIELLSPSRETTYRTLPSTGGTDVKSTPLNRPVLNMRNIRDILGISNSIRGSYAEATHSDYEGAWDIELGFRDDKLWLFQIRPFVENRNASATEYLESISPNIDTSKEIPLSAKII